MDQWQIDLSNRLKTLVDRPSTKWPNQAEPNPNADSKMAVTFVVDAPEQVDLKNGSRYRGFMHLMIRTRLNRGDTESRVIRDAILDLFEPPLDLGSVRIERMASVSTGVEEEGYWAVPMMIPFVALYT